MVKKLLSQVLGGVIAPIAPPPGSALASKAYGKPVLPI